MAREVVVGRDGMVVRDRGTEWAGYISRRLKARQAWVGKLQLGGGLD